MLTDTEVKKARPAAKQYKMPDERGLHLLVRPTGAKLWQLRFRFDGKERTASLGQYPDVTLKLARERRDELRKLIATGTDPVNAKRQERTARQVSSENTFEAVAREW